MELTTVAGLVLTGADEAVVETGVTDTGVDDGELAVVATTVPLVVSEAETDAIDVGDEAVEAETDVKLDPDAVGLTTAVEFVGVSEMTVPLEVDGKDEVGSVVGGEVTETSVPLFVADVIVPVPLPVGGTEVTRVGDEVTEGELDTTIPVPELVGVAEVSLAVVLPKMLEIMLPRSVVEVDVGVETPTSDDVVAEDVTPVEAGPETPAVVVGAELDTPVSVGVRVETSVGVESVGDVTGVEVAGTLVVVGASTEVNDDIRDDKISVADVVVGTAVDSVVVGTTLDSTPVAEVVVGTGLETTGLVDVVGTALSEAVAESDAEVEVGKIEPIMEDKNPGSVVELVGAVEAPVPENEMPEETTEVALSMLDTLVAEDAPVPEKLTPDAVLDSETIVADELVGSVDVDDTTPPGPNVIALPVLEEATEETLEAELAVGETTTSGTDPVDATELEGVGETTTEGALPLEATDATEADVSDVDSVDSVEDSVDADEEETVSSEDVEEAVGKITLSGIIPVDATELVALAVVVGGATVESGETSVV